MDTNSDNNFIEAMFDLLTEAFEGGQPNAGTRFLTNTKADGTGNQGLLPILEGLSAAQASSPTALGVSVTTLTARLLWDIEVQWQLATYDDSFTKDSTPFATEVSPLEWDAQRADVKAVYHNLKQFVQSANEWDLMTVFASVTYHLGLIAQTAKLARD
jgi:hypothetical protein